MTEIKPLFSFFNKNLLIKNKLYIILIIIAGFLDILTTLIGINYFNLSEVNLSLFYYGFPFGVFVWVSLFIIYLVIIDYSVFITKNNKKINEVKKQETIKFLGYYKYLIPIVSFIVPLYNFILICGVV